ncbi:site-specific recombinase [Chitinivorax tropicus]|uniref:Site-specific recombinase n=1 Tax=Chitinivorax tropicus TaxID=714531 RepID=A0A840MQQ2_9PROT|nr:site-specific recombinase [Chitinivorax tropicus]MBB5019409.1 site-specific recombinase [Chitinivorax tropicus]
MELILQQLAAHPSTTDIGPLEALVASIRPQRANDGEIAVNNLRALILLLQLRPAYRDALRLYLLACLASRKQLHLYADVGILPNAGFFSELRNKLAAKLLPPAVNPDYLRDMFGEIFNQRDDHVWVSAVPDDVWQTLFDTLRGDRIEGHQRRFIIGEMLDAAQVLSYRISSMGLEPELVRNHPDIERFESPFLKQNVEIVDYINRHRNWLIDQGQPREDHRHALVLLDQCELVMAKIRKQAAVSGASVSLTYLLVRLQQSLQRLRTLLQLIEPGDLAQKQALALALFKELLWADNRKLNIRDFFRDNVELVARQVTEHASRTGEHYVTHGRRDYWFMLRSAAGAGFIVGFMALIKILATKLHAPPLIEAFLFSMNYALGFMLVHRLHFTIATKQPAMTAAHIAAAIQDGNGKTALDNLTELVVRVARSQFVAIIGNVFLAIPTAYAIGWLWYWGTGSHLVDPPKVQRLLHDINPVQSLALFHAAIAGVCLFLAGLISGYYDNKVVYDQIPERLQQRPLLQRLLGNERLGRFANYIRNNLGGLSGNFYFGFMLGTIGTIGALVGLPIDIRHITFSAANFAYSLVGLENQMPWQTVLWSIAGIWLIGMTNLTVSFSLALWVALRSRRIRFDMARPLGRAVLKRLLTRPGEFFFPPRVEKTDDNLARGESH